MDVPDIGFGLLERNGVLVVRRDEAIDGFSNLQRRRETDSPQWSLLSKLAESAFAAD
jgi:hypothetical protein